MQMCGAACVRLLSTIEAAHVDESLARLGVVQAMEGNWQEERRKMQRLRRMEGPLTGDNGGPPVDAAPQPGRWWTIANGVRVDKRDRNRLAQLIDEAVIEERDRCCQLVVGNASSDK